MQRNFDLKKIYLHGIYTNYDYFDSERSLVILEKILESKYILSRKKRGDINKSTGGYNGINYISLCNYLLRKRTYHNNNSYKGYNSYSCFCKKSISLVLSKEKLKTVKPIILPPSILDYNGMVEMNRLGNDNRHRFSDMPDEVQVKNEISLNSLVAFSLPINHMIFSESAMNYSNIKSFLEELRKILKEFNYEKPVYDITTWMPLNDEKDLSLVIKKHEKQFYKSFK